MQLVSLSASLWLCYWNWRSKQANVLDSSGFASTSPVTGFSTV